MSDDAVPGRLPVPDPRWTRLLAVAVTAVFLLPPPAYVLTASPVGGGGSGPPGVVLPLVTALALLHLRHAVGSLREERPRGWVLSGLAVVAIAYVPLPWWGYNWASMQVFAIATVLLLVRGRLRWVLVVLPLVVMAVWTVVTFRQFGAPLPGAPLLWLYWWGGLLLGGVSLWGTVRLVRVLEDLLAAREELAQAAVDRERLRLSRDLHDLLGQSLSAVSLKGDLALALLHRDPAAARREVAGLTEVAREALHEVRGVVQDERRPDLARELEGAAALLAAAGIVVQVRDDRPPSGDGHAPPLLAWAVREGVTNVLRHSAATRCTITLCHRDGTARLSVANDGARGDDGGGSGIAGLRARGRPYGADVLARRLGDRFELVVAVPLRDAVPA